jgi:hypothetical protein
MNTSNCGAWLHIVSGLQTRKPQRSLSSAKLMRCGLCEHRHFPPCPAAGVVSIRRVQRQTDLTILVSWSNATRGHFQDQVWRAGYARIAGTCGLTGQPVQRGDHIFRPASRVGSVPVNATEMILADAISRRSGKQPVHCLTEFTVR